MLNIINAKWEIILNGKKIHCHLKKKYICQFSSIEEAAYAPGKLSDQHSNSTLYSSTIVHSVQSLYISCYVLSNKSVLS